MKKKKTNNEGGYLLLEMIIAVSILAGGLLIGIRALSEAARAEEISRENSTAMTLLRERSAAMYMELEKAKEEGREIIPAEGDFGTRAAGYRWRAEKSADANLPGEWAIIKVTWGEGGNERYVDTKILLKPAEKEEKKEMSAE